MASPRKRVSCRRQPELTGEMMGPSIVLNQEDDAQGTKLCFARLSLVNYTSLRKRALCNRVIFNV